MKQMTYRDFVNALPRTKRQSDTTWAKIVLRPLSLPVAWILHNLGVSGNAVSVACVLLVLLGCAFLASVSFVAAMIAIATFSLVALGDCVDGNIARAAKQTGPGGEWVDALAGYTMCGGFPLALGWRVEMLQPEVFAVPGAWVLLGAIGSTSNLFMRVVHQKYVNEFRHKGRQSSEGSTALLAKISGEIGMCGWMLPLLLLAVCLRQDAIYLVVYTATYGTAAIALTLLLLRRILARNKGELSSPSCAAGTAEN